MDNEGFWVIREDMVPSLQIIAIQALKEDGR
jgi:hypothetical protein